MVHCQSSPVTAFTGSPIKSFGDDNHFASSFPQAVSGNPVPTVYQSRLLRLCPWVKFLVEILQMFSGNVCVNLCGRDIGVPQHSLDDAQVGAAFDEMGRE